MNKPRCESIEEFNESQAPGDREVCETLRSIIDRHLPRAESRIWYAHACQGLAP